MRPSSLGGRAYLALALLLAAVFVLRLPSLFEPPWYDDEGIYAAIAHSLLRGEVLYRDVLDNRPPGIYWLYAALMAVSGYEVAALKLAATVSVLLTGVVLFLIARRFWGERAGLLAAGVHGLLTSLYPLEGNIANAELFMMLPTSLGMLLLLHRQPLAAGTAFSVAALIKQIAGTEFLAAIAVVLVAGVRRGRTVALMVLGSLIPVGLTVLYLLSTGVLAEAFFATLTYYLGYVQQADARLPSWLIAPRVLLVGVAVFWVARQARAGRAEDAFRFALVTLWLVFAVFGALFTTRPYPHYLLQAVPPLSLALAGLMVNRRSWFRQFSRRRWAPMLVPAAGMLAFLLAVFVPWPHRLNLPKTYAYYENFALHVTGQRSEQAYNDFFDKRVNRNLALADFFEANASPRDYLVVWGEEPWLYPLTGLRLGSPYSVSYYAYEMPGGLRRVVESLQRERATYVVWTTNKPLYPELQAALERDFAKVGQIENAEIYMHRLELVRRGRGAPAAGSVR